MKYLKLITIIVALLFIVANIKAQNYSTLAEVLSSGGSESTGSNYTIFGVLGETFVDYPVVGGNYETSIGFLYHAEGIPVNTPGISSDNTIRVFPNPTTEILNIEKYNSSIWKIEIYNILGNKVFECEYKNKINVSKLTNGLYFLRLIDDNGSIVHLEKIIKK